MSENEHDYLHVRDDDIIIVVPETSGMVSGGSSGNAVAYAETVEEARAVVDELDTIAESNPFVAEYKFAVVPDVETFVDNRGENDI